VTPLGSHKTRIGWFGIYVRSDEAMPHSEIGSNHNTKKPGDQAMNPVYDFSGQVALVTGASSGIGLASVKAFAEAGAAVVLADINEDALRTATEELTAAGHQVIGVTCDVADEAQVAQLAERTIATYGKLDMAFNNAGIVGFTGDPAEESAESFDKVVAINLRGIWTCMKHELRQMRTQGSGGHRELLIPGRPGRTGGPGHLSRDQAWRDRADQERRHGLRATWHSDQCRLPGRDRDAYVDGPDRKPAGRDEGGHARPANWPAGAAGGGRRRRSVAVQPGRKPRARRRSSR